MPCSGDLPVPHPPAHLTVENESEDEAATEVRCEEQDDPTFEIRTSSCEHHLITQGEFYNLVWDLNLSKKKQELSGFMQPTWRKYENPVRLYVAI